MRVRLRNAPYSLTLLAALAVLLVAWFLPFPPLLAGEEAFASQTIQADRTKAQTASQQFQAAQVHYQTYIKTHDMGALLNSARNAITQVGSAPDDTERLVAVKNQTAQIIEYAGVLRDYAQASDQYFSALQGYDDKLMGWTRALGAASESLRPATFPFVEHLKLYPIPTGEKADPPDVSATQIAEQITALSSHAAALDPNPDPRINVESTVTTLNQIGQDITNIWASGRSVEYVASLHDDYYAMLRTYDGQVLVLANSSGAGPDGGRRAVATGFTLLLGTVTLGGLAMLFMSGAETRV